MACDWIWAKTSVNGKSFTWKLSTRNLPKSQNRKMEKFIVNLFLKTCIEPLLNVVNYTKCRGYNSNNQRHDSHGQQRLERGLSLTEVRNASKALVQPTFD